MKKTIYLSLLFLLFLSCKTNTYGTWQNDSIDESIRKEIDKIDKEILISIDTDNPERLKKVVSDGLLEKSGSELKDITKEFSSIVDQSEYSILDQYYIKNTSTGNSNNITSDIRGAENYKISYLALNEEMFVSLIVTNNKLDKTLITNIYGKYPDGWKLNIMQLGQYTINGKTAPELYRLANQQYDNGCYIDAALNIFLCMQVLKPGNDFWQYNNEKEMQDFYDEVISQVNELYTFPIIIDKIKSEPEILNIAPQGMNEGYFPMINYLSKINLQDTVNLKIENEQIHSLMGEYFKGIDLNKKYLFYKAWNEMPDGKNSKPTYGFTKEL